MSPRVVLVLLVTGSLGAPAAHGAIVDPAVRQALASAARPEGVPIIVRLADRPDLSRYHGRRSEARDLIRELLAKSDHSRAPVLARLRARGFAGSVRTLWIDNSLALTAPVAVVDALANDPGVERVDFDEPVRFDTNTAQAGPTFDWNIVMVGADQAWILGVDGTGIVVGSMDTGFDPSHPALAGKWRGGTNSWMDIINNIGTPYDDHGHGTHTIGTMVGGDGPGPFPDDVGLAYNAKFISAKVLDATNSFSTASIVIGGAQWMLNPDQNPNTDDFPHVINNSWYFSDPATTIFYGTASTWRAAGIIPVFCNGNEGPLPRTVMAPASYNNTLGIGATTSTDTIAPFSSRGPTLPGTSYPSDRRKPDLSAPGDLVRSSLPGGFYSEWSGTSMAAPHVAGAIALMLQRHSSLTFDEIRTELRSSAVDRGLPGFDNDFGYGRLDVRAAVVLALTGVEDGGVTAAAPVVAAPNPFRDRVRFALNGAAPRSIEVFDLAGRRVWSATTQGGGALEWDGRDAYGRAVPAGVFLMRSSDGHTATTARILRVR